MSEKVDSSHLFYANAQALGMIDRAKSLSPTAKTMARLHVVKPWIEDFLGMAVSPLKRSLRVLLGPYLFSWRDLAWYYPDTGWWKAHARRSHAPGDGAGCDVDVHVDWLTPDGKEAEFAYASVLRDDSIHVLGRPDFERECQFWREEFDQWRA